MSSRSDACRRDNVRRWRHGRGRPLRRVLMSEEPELLWQPTPARAARSTLTRYMRWLQNERGLQFGDYAELWKWAVDELEEFWGSLVEFFEVRFSEGGSTVLGERSMPGAQWFPGARCSFAEHVFRGKRDEDVAIRHASELRSLDSWSDR